MEFFQVIASATQRAPIVSALITDYAQLPPFAQGDLLDGKVTAVVETGDPTAPTEAFPLDACSGIALTNGKDTTYATAGAIAVTGNVITFTLEVGSVELDAAFTETEDDYIDGYLEVRAALGGQDGLLLREPVTIERAALGV